MKRIPSLDGLRAISIVLVLIGHLCGTRGFPLPRSPLMDLYANLGVRVFFVISGFLITTLLLKEHAKTKRIDVWQFYVRRAYRIWPAALAFTTLALIVFWCKFSALDITAAYLYFSNFRASRPWELAHLWSLAVEEQFYLLWPGLLALAFARRRAFAIGAIALAPVSRFILWYTVGPDASSDYFPAVMDALASGCLLAMVYERLPRWIESLWCLLLWPVLFALPVYHSGSRLQMFAGLTLVHALIAALVANSVKRAYAALNATPVAWVGVMSYSLYLCQQPFLNRASFAWWCAFPQNIVLAFLAAIGCHYGIEQPFLRMRERQRSAVRTNTADTPTELSSVLAE